jgi:hypothetical protein
LQGLTDWRAALDLLNTLDAIAKAGAKHHPEVIIGPQRPWGRSSRQNVAEHVQSFSVLRTFSEESVGVPLRAREILPSSQHLFDLSAGCAGKFTHAQWLPQKPHTMFAE